ncbi:hypothetical protein GCM10010994_30650 [Chelatococcus reniformis]|uniref:Autotransporter domain-containing protein n=1 Tax=Chelatococcus reniformis TaxID=1494448 RepID=A0A916XGE4_9HYPH|nr:hypothetical protein GCM10010994_30650 [Chelatococcus reniformis]
MTCLAGGIGLAALVCGLAGGMRAARAEDVSGELERLQRATSGDPGHDAGSSFAATAGGAAAALIYRARGRIGRDGLNGPVIDIKSSGGNGGGGSGSRPPGAGGDGGAITFNQFGMVAGASAPGGLISLFSQGGNGGGGTSGLDGTNGQSGGRGGDVSLAQYGTIVSPSGAGGQLVVLRSVGGQGGVNTGSGGAGGKVSLIQSGAIRTGAVQTNGLPLISLQSAGGKGGDTGTRDGGVGGTGGAVAFTQSGAPIEASGTQASAGVPLIWLVSQGGQGGDGRTATQADSTPILVWRGGSGGAASSVAADLGGNVTTRGDNFAAVRATSQGGASGRYGNVKGRASGSASVGGAAGTVSVTIAARATVATTGAHAPAVIAEARAGQGTDAAAAYFAKGGTGGSVVDTPTTPSVRFVNDGVVSTSGANATAVVLQSVGGNGGSSRSGDGEGGAGGAAGRIVAIQHGAISTIGPYSFGIVAQSIGGTGGRGSGGLFIGDPGGRAGDGGAVTVANVGAITTQGEGATAIVAQSVGGGSALDAFQSQAILPKGVKAKEGVGAIDVTAGPGGGQGGDSLGYFFARGGDGGSGGDGALVKVLNEGRITTGGDSAYGILAQSVGGSGGAAGDAIAAGAFLSVSLGGHGGGGGTGGAVQVGSEDGAKAYVAATAAGQARSPSIETSGADAVAILAQSIGGGGGSGGSAIAASGGVLGAVSVSVGGSGGQGGAGGTVDIWNTSAVTTAGAGAMGIEAQSIGGGGGNAGSARSYAVAVGAGYIPAVAVSVAVGGKGGDGGVGGAVTLHNFNAITTKGASANAIDAQSIGGGGGSAGNAFAYALAVQTSALPSVDVNVAVGGSNGKGGAGGKVAAESDALIETFGNDSKGISLLSVGGGGGSGGTARSVEGLASFYANIGVPVTIGGKGGGGGAGDEAKVVNNGFVHTLGQFSNAIDVSSIGGGGGKGGSADSAAAAGLGYEGPGAATIGTLVDALPIAKSITADVTIGGGGGKGGAGGAVIVDNNRAILTEGSNSTAIAAYSIGGGGGSGGGFQGGGSGTIAANVRIGGSGGDGGNGGTVTVTNAGNASISTLASGSHGIFAQSVGGGGGNGGTFTGTRKSAAVDRLTANPSDWTTWLPIANMLAGELTRANDVGKMVFAATPVERLPGESDADHRARQAKANEFKMFKDPMFDKGSSLQNIMDKAPAITAILKAATSLVDPKKTVGEKIDAGVAALLATTVTALGDKVGDALKKAGIGQAAKDKLKGTTWGSWQEDYPSVAVNVSVGGRGGEGGSGGAVTVKNDGSITTADSLAYGVFAQSVGGGGGAGGGGLATGENILNVDVSVGGSGGKGGNGGAVVADNKGLILTDGAASYGLFAQSIGGGGGVGGASSAESSLSFSVNTVIGGNGGTSGAGGTVTVTNSGTIATAGRDAHAIVAQSVGGGGGVYFNNLKSPRELELERKQRLAAEADAKAKGTTLTGNTLTPTETEQARQAEAAIEATKTFLQSLGMDAGGTAGVDRWSTILPNPQASLTIGGNGRAGGNGGAVGITHTGHITTSGIAAFGILAQSIGGGGGFGSDATNGWLPVNVAIGGAGGAYGNGGAVTVSLGREASVTTSGAGAHAIFAQSIGGGGGYGGTALNQILPNFVNRSGGGGAGGAITLSLTPGGGESRLAIVTTGARAHAILAQSLGGGGGMLASLAGPAIPVANTVSDRSGGSENHGGKITVATAGTISATGADSYGIFAQSGVQAADGSISVPVPHSTHVGIYSRTTYDHLGGDITIKHIGDIIGGSGSGAAIRIDGGASNTITINQGSTVAAASGTAIVSTWGREAVDNSGTIVGNVDLTSGATLNLGVYEVNSFHNQATGVLQTGEMIRLGRPLNGISFVNDGVVNIGGTGVISTTTLTGNFTQTAAGRLLVDISPPATAAELAGQAGPWLTRPSPAPSGPSNPVARFFANLFGGSAPAPEPVQIAPLRASDLLEVTGSAAVDGTIVPNAITWLLPGAYTIVKADGGVSGAPVVAGAQPVAVPITWDLVNAGTSLSLIPKADFANPRGVSLTTDQQSAAQQLQSAWDAGSLAQGTAFPRFLSVAAPAQYAAALDELNQESSQYTATTKVLGVQAALRAPLSCPAFAGAGTLLEEGECVWGRISGGYARMSPSRDDGGYRQNDTTYRMGAQTEVRPGWFIGASGSYTRGDMKDPDGITGTGSDAYDGSIAVKHQIGPWLFSASATAGYGWQRNLRSISIGSTGATALSKSKILTLGAQVRGAYELTFSNWYIRPYVDLAALYLRTPSYTEWGAPGLNLNVLSQSKTLYSVSPNVEIGGRFDLASGYWLRPFGTVGFTLLSDDGFVGLAALQGNVDGAFATTSRVPDRLLDVGLGVQIASGTGLEFTAEYQAHTGRDYLAHTGTARLAWRF